MDDSDLRDPSEYVEASEDDGPCKHILEALCPKCGLVVDASCPKCGANVEASGAEQDKKQAYDAASYRRLLLTLDKWPDARFTLQCYFVATGDSFAHGYSMTSIAKRFGRTKESVSKRCRQICEALGIQRSGFMRGEEAAQTFRLRNARPKTRIK